MFAFLKILLTIFGKGMSEPITIQSARGYPRLPAYRYRDTDYEFPQTPTYYSSVPSNRISLLEHSHSTITDDASIIEGEGGILFYGPEELGPEVSDIEHINHYRGNALSISSPVASAMGPDFFYMNIAAPFELADFRAGPRHGVSSQAIASLKHVRFSDLSNSDEICAICLDKYSYHNLSQSYGSYGSNRGHADVLELPCGHSFGESCIKTWLEEQHTCPSCRDDLESSIVRDDCTRVTSGGSSILRISTSALDNLVTLSRTRSPAVDQQDASQTQETVLEYTRLSEIDRLRVLADRYSPSTDSLEDPAETPPFLVSPSHRAKLSWEPVLEYAMTGRIDTGSENLSGRGNIDDGKLLVTDDPLTTNTAYTAGTDDHSTHTSMPGANSGTAGSHHSPSLSESHKQHTPFPSFKEWQKEKARPKDPTSPTPIDLCLEELDAIRRLRKRTYSDPWAINPANYDIVDETSGWNDVKQDDTDVHSCWPKSDITGDVSDQNSDEDEFGTPQDDSDDYGTDDYECTNDYKFDYAIEDEREALLQRKQRDRTKLLRILGCEELPIDIWKLK